MSEKRISKDDAALPEDPSGKDGSDGKKPYTAPSVKEYGNISKLTLAKSGPNFDATAERRA